MPFTPLHAGPGLLFKGLCGRKLSLLSFLTVQVAIDIEPLYSMMTDQWPLHRVCHTLLGATVVAGVVIVLMTVSKNVTWLRSVTNDEGEFSLGAIVIGSMVGAWSHVLLDSMVHLDVKPFEPFKDATPLYGLIEWEQISWLCFTCAAAGLVFHYINAKSTRTPELIRHR